MSIAERADLLTCTTLWVPRIGKPASALSPSLHLTLHSPRVPSTSLRHFAWVVNESGNTVYTSYAAPTKKVTDYRTHVSGILARHIDPVTAPPFARVQAEVRALIKDRVVVGHALENDFDALQLRRGGGLWGLLGFRV